MLFMFAGVAYWCSLAASVVVGSGAVAAASTTTTQSFTTAGTYNVTVPANATQVQIEGVGGAGTSGQSASGGGGAAGSGTDVNETLSVGAAHDVTPGENLTVVVGSRGGGGGSGAGGYIAGIGGKGGGATYVVSPFGGTLLVAGGGGGGGGASGIYQGDGGAGGTDSAGSATYVVGSIAARGGIGAGQCGSGPARLLQGQDGETDTAGDSGGGGGGGGEGWCGAQSGGSGDHGAGKYVTGAGGGGGGAGGSLSLPDATSLSIAGTSNTGDGSLTLTYTVVAPATATPSASTISFADRQVGTTSQTQYVTLTNNGDLPLTFDGLYTVGDESGEFVANPGTCGTTIVAHSSCELGASFSPTAAGDRSAILVVNDSGPDSPQEIILTGHALAPATATLSPSSIAFGNQEIDTTSAAKQVTLTNNGDVALTFNGVSVSGLSPGNFSADSGNCGSTIAAHSSCAIDVKFSPQATRIQSATLVVTDSAPDSPQRIGLSGNGALPPDPVLEESDVAFGAQPVGTTSKTQDITLENKAAVPLTLTGVAASGQDAGDFTAGSGTCGTSVPANSSCKLSVSFSPTAPGDRSATVLISDNAPDSPQRITLSGTGTEATSATLSAPQSPTAGSQIVLSATVKPIPDGGTVAFADNGNPVTGCQSQPVNTTTGTASCSLSYTSAGNHTVTASYGGDAAFGGSAATTAFTVSGPSTQSVSPQGTNPVSQLTTTTSLAATGTSSANQPAPMTMCVVPRLDHKTLSQARRALSRAHCGVGAVHKPAHLPANRVAHIGRQSTAAGTRKHAGFRVSIWLIG
jgi:hypothetical protein